MRHETLGVFRRHLQRVDRKRKIGRRDGLWFMVVSPGYEFVANQFTVKNCISTRSGCRTPEPMNSRSVIQPKAVEAVSKLGLQRK